ncbi:MAG: NAD(P) transhydrogenase subunit alpha [Planctomycetota bacterium]|nr:NAD(P) transhydrogenase subunit alpha [Planctomycetota bacterium]
MKAAILREVLDGETRVALVPETVRRLEKLALEIVVEAGAGEKAYITDADYQAAGAHVQADAEKLLAEADLVLKVNPPADGGSAGRNELAMLKAGTILVAILQPSVNLPLVRRLAEGNITSFALDAIPRITRGQSMDVLSSMSMLAGYKAALLAAGTLSKITPMMMTAAGTFPPAKAVVIGAGVAGLQAIATLRRLGVIVKAVDTRPAVKEETETLGAQFITLEVEHTQAQDAGGYAMDLGEDFYKQEQDILAPHVQEADVVISTALIPNRRAPLLISEQMVSQMKPGAVIVDLAAAGGGNCTLSQPDQRVVRNNVTIIAPLNLSAKLPVHASQMFSRNIATFVAEFVKDGQVQLDMENEIIAGCMITHQGKITHEATLKAIESGEVKP